MESPSLLNLILDNGFDQICPVRVWPLCTLFSRLAFSHAYLAFRGHMPARRSA